MSGGTTKVHSDGKRPSLKSSVIKELDEVSTKETHRDVSSQDRSMHSNSLTEMQLVKRRAKASAAKAFVGSRQAFKCFLEAFETVCTRRMRTTLDSRVSFPLFFLACVRLSLLAIKPSQNAVTFLVRSVYTIVRSKSCSIRLHFFLSLRIYVYGLQTPEFKFKSFVFGNASLRNEQLDRLTTIPRFVAGLPLLQMT